MRQVNSQNTADSHFGFISHVPVLFLQTRLVQVSEMAARSILLLHSTLATCAGLALIFWDDATSFILTKGGDKAGALRAYNAIIGGVLVFMGSLLCTAAANATASAIKGVFSGAMTAAAAFAWLILAPTVAPQFALAGAAKLNPQFVAGGAAVFAFIALTSLAALPGAKKHQPAVADEADKKKQ